MEAVLVVILVPQDSPLLVVFATQKMRACSLLFKHEGMVTQNAGSHFRVANTTSNWLSCGTRKTTRAASIRKILLSENWCVWLSMPYSIWPPFLVWFEQPGNACLKANTISTDYYHIIINLMPIHLVLFHFDTNGRYIDCMGKYVCLARLSHQGIRYMTILTKPSRLHLKTWPLLLGGIK